MGKPYDSELASLPRTYDWARSADIKPLVTAFRRASALPLIAIGSGGWSGIGFKAPNTQIELGFLPATAVHNDYIFSAIAEQWGFVGGIVLIGAFALLLLTCLFVAFFAGDQFGLLLVVGISALIFTHIFQNIGMTISMLPITGVPLPLVSYSGSFALMIMFGLGIVNSVWVHRKAAAGL